MNVLITGAAGGIGSTLCLLLKRKGHNVFGLDNLNNGYKENLFENGEQICEFIEMDIRETDKLRQFLQEKQIDSVVHLAALTSLPECESNPAECISVNVGGTASVLNAARFGGQHVIVASTSAIYENNSKAQAPFMEEIEVKPRLFYPLSKKLMEETITSYIKNYKMNITTLRFFNVFGPRQDIHRKSPPLINYIVREVKNDRKMTFYSNGFQMRDYIHVDDVANMIEVCLNKKYSEIFNVCTGTLTSVRDIIKYAKKAFDKKIDYSFEPSVNFWNNYGSLYEGKCHLDNSVLDNEVNKFALGSTSKSKLLLGWEPNKNIESLMIQTMRENYERYSK
jgi:nucleoside-diphosphate-sugar epimerase